MTAAQLYEAACKADPSIPGAIGKGNFGPLMAWLRPNVHERGSSMTTAEIVTAATGRPLDVEVFKKHLTRRYLPN
jgi:carboxypeptidase Taq